MRKVKSPLGRVLTLLRLVRDANNPNLGMHAIFSNQLKIPQNSPEYFRFLAATIELVDEAEQAIADEPRFGEEGRKGVLHTLRQLRSALHSPGMDQPAKNFLQNLDLQISQFSLIADIIQSDEALTDDAEKALDALDTDLSDLYQTVKNADIDERAKKTVLANITALQVLLRNTDLFGFDAAKSAYIDLLSAIQRQARKSERASKFFEGVWPNVEKWGSRIRLLNDVVHASGKLLTVGKGVIAAAGSIGV